MAKTHCPKCSAVLNVSDGATAKKVRCPKCQHTFSPGQPGMGADQVEMLVALAKAKEVAERILESAPPGERACCKCGSTDGLAAFKYHAYESKEMEKRKVSAEVMHVWTTYHRALNTADWVCATCLETARKSSFTLAVVAASILFLGQIAVCIWAYWTGLWGFFMGFILGPIGSAFWPAVIIWFARSTEANAFGQNIALDCNRLNLRKQGYRHFGTDHLQRDTVDDVLRRGQRGY